MDHTGSKKRDTGHTIPQDLSSHKLKRSKIQESDLGLLFFRTLSDLSERKKNIIRKLGFGALLDFSCSSNVNDIFYWLVDHLDTDDCTVKLEHGFSFTVSPSIANIILGIPLGNKIVYTKISKEANDIINGIVQSENASVEHICDMLSKHVDMDEVAFSIIFMLAALSAFIATNGRGVVSSRYYQAVIDFVAEPDHDWCSFMLNWLLLNIKKYKANKAQGVLTEIGGCKHLPVITYFEYLITSEFNLGESIPRLPLWTTNIVNSFIALDSFNASPTKFGRLPRKHIASTIFRGTCQPTEWKMPVEIKKYINQKLQGIHATSEKRKIELLANNFFQGILHDSMPTVRRYVDDIVTCTVENQNVPEQECTNSHPPLPTEWEAELLTRKLFSQDQIELKSSIHGIMHSLTSNLSSMCTVNEDNWELEMQPSHTDLLFKYMQPQFQSIPEEYTRNYSFTDFLCHSLEEFRLIEQQNYRIEQAALLNQKYSMRSNKFLSPSEFKEEDEMRYDEPLQLGNLFLLSNQSDSTPEQKQGSKCQSVPNKQFKIGGHEKYGSAPILKTRNQDFRGFSLNERVLGKRIEPSFTESQSEFPSFELFPVSKDPSSHTQLRDNTEGQFIGSVRNHQDQDKPQTNDEPDKILNNSKLDETKQQSSNYTNVLEHNFYKMLTDSTNKYSPRIFEIHRVWVDQRTFTLSMREGGWMHSNLMDCFGKLMNISQYWRDKEGTAQKNDILKHVIIKDSRDILMDPNLNYKDPSYKFLFSRRNVGFKLDHAGLVHIPCPNNKQWVLITVNFIDKCFDVLNPDHCNEKFIDIIDTVIRNFKVLFVKDYPCEENKKISEFPIRYVVVPKHIFRYDSGIFVIQYMLTYNGIAVPHFSNDDIQKLREKFTFQLVMSRHNEHQVPLVKAFLSKHAPHLVR